MQHVFHRSKNAEMFNKRTTSQTEININLDQACFIEEVDFGNWLSAKVLAKIGIITFFSILVNSKFL